MGQHICFGAICDIVVNTHINVIKGTFTLKRWLHGYMSYRTYRLCPFIIFLTFKSGLGTNNHIGLLIVCLIINIFPFYFQTRIYYVFYALDRHHNLLVLTHCKLTNIKPLKFWLKLIKLEYRGLLEIQKANQDVSFNMYIVLFKCNSNASHLQSQML